MKNKIYGAVLVLLMIMLLVHYKVELNQLQTEYKRQQASIDAITHNIKVVNDVNKKQLLDTVKREGVSRETKTKIVGGCAISSHNIDILRKYADDINHHYSK